MTVLHDISINGSGSSGGGSFDKVTIRGEGTITNNLECRIFRTYGTSSVQGHLKTDSFSMYGESTIGGALTSTDMKVLGSLTVNDLSTSKQFKIRGSLDSKKGVKGETADVKGGLTVEGDVELEKLDLSGNLQVTGMLNAGTIDIQLRFGESKLNEIGGETIQIRRKKPLPFVKTEGYLEAKIIEGDTIFLESTKADIVRGKRVTIGQDCDIQRVEFSEHLEKQGNPIVGEEQKM